MVMSALSIFCAPKTESSYNIMGDTTERISNRMKVETFNASRILSMLCKHFIQQDTPPERSRYFTGDNKYYSPIDSSLVTNMQLARSKKRLDNIQVHAENANPMWKVNLVMPRRRANILL